MKLSRDGFEYWLYSFSSWGTQNQSLEKFRFQDLLEQDRITPIRYLCDIRPRRETESGILHFRKQMGISQLETANLMEIPTSSLCKYETGENQCSVAACQKMVKLYGVSVDDLLQDYPVKTVTDPILL